MQRVPLIFLVDETNLESLGGKAKLVEVKVGSVWVTLYTLDLFDRFSTSEYFISLAVVAGKLFRLRLPLRLFHEE